MFTEITEKIETFLRNGSGWVVESMLAVNLHVTKYNPITGGSYLKLPDKIAKKSSLLNIQNTNDEMCFSGV